VTERPGPRKGGGSVSPRGTRYSVEVRVDGKKLELKEFLHDLIGGAIDGMLGGLREVENPRTVRVDVERL
jgi:hypothetical protein